ncbi:MAG: hypothetical protein HY343_02225 [Lentisphaerae bacterium]|nr:hypothetical protein [Lentisphaerota bacterium]
MMDKPFKRCTTCGHLWNKREDFLADPHVTLVGYQVNFVELTAGFFLFNHDRKDCQTTLGIMADEFADLYAGPIFEENRKGLPGCPDYCQVRGNLRPCASHCECSFVREIIQLTKNWPKKATPP